MPVIEGLQRAGKAVAVDLESDLWHLPPWHPHSHTVNEMALDCLGKCLDVADQISVSTPALASLVHRSMKTSLLPSLLDLDDWPEPGPEAHERVRPLWAGGLSHSKDLDEIGFSVERIAKDYGEYVTFMFMGDLPEALCEYNRVKYSQFGIAQPAARLKGRVNLTHLVPADQYPKALRVLEADVGLAPLADHPYNRCRSNLPWLEYSAAGMATLGTDLPPYAETTALCVPPDIGCAWQKAMRNVIEDKKLRQTLASASLQNAQLWTWQGATRSVWCDFYRHLVYKEGQTT